MLSNMTSGELSKLLSLATGWELTPRTLVEVGSRSFTLKRLINNAFGAGRGDDRLPGIVLEPYASGPIQGVSPREELEAALTEYYGVRGWDPGTGVPYEETVKSLGLSEHAARLSVQLPRREAA